MSKNRLTDAEILARARRYIRNEPDEYYRDQIKRLCEQQSRGDQEAAAELHERFASELAFGTGGLRGLVGGGDSRMNPLAVRRTTQGLADYMKHVSPDNLSAVIAFDSRRTSPRFAEEAALVLAANGVKTYLFSRLQPTPILSFTVRRLGACAGIVITASHNPPDYNGYKVAWSDGAQIVGERDAALTEAIGRVEGRIVIMEREEALTRGLLVMLDDDALEPYYRMAVGRMLRRDEGAGQKGGVRIVYTPLHGAGFIPVIELFRRLGYHVTTVPEQCTPDGDFPFAPVPNPEYPTAFERAFTVAAETRAGLILATDPDADRLGVAVPDRNGYRLLSGNEVGVLMLDYILETLAEQRRLPTRAYIVKSIVTSELERRIAARYGVSCIDTLTGFKHICAVMRAKERENPDDVFLFANEESCGYLIETEVRDKDGVTAAALVAEMANAYEAEGKTLLDRLHEIHVRDGLFLDFQVAKVFAGAAGKEVIRRLMEALREDPRRLLPPSASIVRVIDYAAGTEPGIPQGNVCALILADGVVSARPSGTEPKIKFYVSLHIDPPFHELHGTRDLEERGKIFRAAIENFVMRYA